jgi:hypothetical protein
LGGGIAGAMEGSEKEAERERQRKLLEEQEKRQRMIDAMNRNLLIKEILLGGLDRGRQRSQEYLNQYDRESARW